jgi:hypothetical protein
MYGDGDLYDDLLTTAGTTWRKTADSASDLKRLREQRDAQVRDAYPSDWPYDAEEEFRKMQNPVISYQRGLNTEGEAGDAPFIIFWIQGVEIPLVLYGNPCYSFWENFTAEDVVWGGHDDVLQNLSQADLKSALLTWWDELQAQDDANLGDYGFTDKKMITPTAASWERPETEVRRYPDQPAKPKQPKVESPAQSQAPPPVQEKYRKEKFEPKTQPAQPQPKTQPVTPSGPQPLRPGVSLHDQLKKSYFMKDSSLHDDILTFAEDIWRKTAKAVGAEAYGTLGVPENATAEQMKGSRNKLLRTWHPDVLQHSWESSIQATGDFDKGGNYKMHIAPKGSAWTFPAFDLTIPANSADMEKTPEQVVGEHFTKIINEAYQALTDPKRKAQIDAEIQRQRTPKSQGGWADDPESTKPQAKSDQKSNQCPHCGGWHLGKDCPNQEHHPKPKAEPTEPKSESNTRSDKSCVECHDKPAWKGGRCEDCYKKSWQGKARDWFKDWRNSQQGH